MSDYGLPAWLTGDVDGIVAKIRRDYAKYEAPYPSSRLSISDHARRLGYSWLSSHALSPSMAVSGRIDYRRTVRLMAAVATAVNRVLDERAAEIKQEREERQRDEPLTCLGNNMDCGRPLPCPDHGGAK